jgi:hypothetical protein
MRLFMRRFLLIACAALVAAIAFSPRQPARAADAPPPSVPDNIRVPAGHKLFLVGHAVGTQNYTCLPSGDGVKFALFTPQATLFVDGKQATTHYFSPNPDEGGVVRATWQHSRDTSTVWGAVQPGHSSADPAFVAPGAIPWLLVTAAGDQAGPTGGDLLTATTYIQRLNTSGGVAPATGCSSPADIGNKAFVPYTTDYYFYKAAP